ncbi:MAG: hypothetical protein GX927_05180 [Lentisphaerae bacterium]|nr:hypothetical protein [Lentisphaerota bacterium]
MVLSKKNSDDCFKKIDQGIFQLVQCDGCANGNQCRQEGIFQKLRTTVTGQMPDLYAK